MRPWTIHQGDVREVARGLEANYFDAMLCDPPYGLSFMGSRWDYFVPSVNTWAALLRCLKPGAPSFIFGGSRTFHRVAVNVEDGGFEIRDLCQWLYGSGFPKSLDVSKALDAKQKVKRTKVLGYKESGLDKGGGHTVNFAASKGRATNGMVPITEASTALRAQWTGFGTALKPGYEPILLARKMPCGSIAENVMRYGVGGIDIDGSRVGVEERFNPPASRTGMWESIAGDGVGPHAIGRWPSNVIFTHSSECVQVGTRRVKAAPAWNANKGPSAFTGEKVSSVHHSDGDGTESVEVWACVPGCPVRMLDGQSGKTKSTRSVVDHVPRPKSASIGGFAGKKDVVIVSDDDGGASRFFYTAKAGRAERDRGCDDLAPGAKGADALRDGGRSDGTDRSVGGGIHTEGVALAKNDHPTIKPQSLIRYFGKMILPPKRTDGKPRRILVPFSGSGSEMIALLQAGWDEVVGIEREAKYIRIADARIKKGEIFKDREKK